MRKLGILLAGELEERKPVGLVAGEEPGRRVAAKAPRRSPLLGVELAHLVEPGHGPRFHALVDRFPRNERADGFLEAMSLGCAADHFLAD